MTRSLTNVLNLVPWFWGRDELVLGALGVETVACWLQSKMDSSRVSLIRCRLNQQSHEAMLPISNI